MKISALTSGSSSNCYYIENKDEAYLVDAGLSAKQLEEKLSQIKRSSKKIKALLITHEHTDHIKGADVIARRYDLDLFATKETINKSSLKFSKAKVHSIKNNETLKFKDISFTAIPKSHSAADPVSFLVKSTSKSALIATDLGHVCKNTADSLSQADLLFIEANHDVKMLEDGPYLPFHKKWVLSNEGHLSNKQAALGVLEHANQSTSKIILSHLSRVNNTPEVAKTSFNELLKERYNFKPEILVSSRDAPTPLFALN